MTQQTQQRDVLFVGLFSPRPLEKYMFCHPEEPKATSIGLFIFSR